MLWDLHFHSTDSDGSKTNAERVDQIKQLDPNNKWIWALTNHDTYSPSFVEEGRAAWLWVLYATEISARSSELDLSLHITCYTPTLSENIKKMIDAVLRGKSEKVFGQIELLRSHGFPIERNTFLKWVVDSGYKLQSISNALINIYLFKQPDFLPRLLELTDGNVKNKQDFLDECLKEGGKYSHLWSFTVGPYEPELKDLIAAWKKEEVVFSVAHPNFSFHRIVQRHNIARDDQAGRTELFKRHIVPVLTDIGMRNYEINALATNEQAQVIKDVTSSVGWILTFWSDNHGKDERWSKHGKLWERNQFLTDDMLMPIYRRLREYV